LGQFMQSLNRWLNVKMDVREHQKKGQDRAHKGKKAENRAHKAQAVK